MSFSTCSAVMSIESGVIDMFPLSIAAKSQVVLKNTGEWLKSMLPDDPESTILKRLKRPKDGEGEEPAPGQKSDATPPGPARNSGEGYARNDRTDMRQLIETRVAPAR